MVAAASPYLQHIHARLQVEDGAHYGHHMRSGYGLAPTDGKRRIVVSPALQRLGEKKLSWHMGHGRYDPRIGYFLKAGEKLLFVQISRPQILWMSLASAASEKPSPRSLIFTIS